MPTQDYPHIDDHGIDGGSTDETVSVLTGYGDRFRWVSEKDRGQTHAINKGMAQARGEIRSYLNSDDLLRPGAVKRQPIDTRTARVTVSRHRDASPPPVNRYNGHHGRSAAL